MIEIRELVIQARLREDAEVGPDGSTPQKEETKPREKDEATLQSDSEMIQKIVDRCLHEVQTWWRDKNLR